MSSRSKSGDTPDWIRSIAPQTLAALSSCQEFDSPIDQSGRRTEESRLPTSSLTVSIAFLATGLVAPVRTLESSKSEKLQNFRPVRRRTLRCIPPETSELH